MSNSLFIFLTLCLAVFNDVSCQSLQQEAAYEIDQLYLLLESFVNISMGKDI